MIRDYKHRAQAKQVQKPVAGCKWVLIILLIVGFGFFLYSLRDFGKALDNNQSTPIKPKQVKPIAKKPKKVDSPRYDFYTILPEKEVIITENEVKNRKLEERIGKAKSAVYQLQAGSFKNHKEADRLRTKLALIGVESRVEKTKISNVIWSRVKIGPYATIAIAERVRKRLRQNKIDAVMMEITK